MKLRNTTISVIGHKNPDTDSICSAIAYSALKNQCEKTDKYVPKRAGQINEETTFVLDRFGVELPGYVSDIGTRIRDIEIRDTQGVDRNLSLKKAWALMKKLDVVTLPITTKNGILEGLITTEDIAESYMEVYDSTILSTAHTKYKNIIETLDGEMILGNPEEYYTKGKVLIAAANPDLMESYIEENDLVILGNRYESQLCAIEMKAACLVICHGAPVSLTIRKIAQEKGCTIIVTPYDTYTAARLINQSMPIGYFMTRDNIVSFRTNDYVDDIKGIMAKKRFRDFPVLNKKDEYMGMISRRNLLNAEQKKVILVDHNEKTQAVDGIENTDILEIIDHHRLATIETMKPVFFRNQPLGCTATIVYQMYLEKNEEIPKHIAGLLCAAILSDTLMYRSPTCTAIDKMAAEALAKIAGINVEEFATEMFSAGSNLHNKSPEEIFYQDFKKFAAEGVTFGVGQINSMSETDLKDIKNKMIPYLEKAYKEHGVSMIFFMLTNILNESTELMYLGNNSKDLVEAAFSKKIIDRDEDRSVVLENVVSRKKQLIPAMISAIANS